MSILEIPVKPIGQPETTLEQYKGKVIVIVNTASKCGLTPQYEGLEALAQQHKDDVVVLGFPSNDFLQQEPGTDDDIKDFCSVKYNVTFPLYSKIRVVGDDKHPLYAELIKQQPITIKRDEMEDNLKGYGITCTEAPEVVWNFEKFIVGKDGKVVARISPNVVPTDEVFVKALNDALKA